jgi:hypothetical protein
MFGGGFGSEFASDMFINQTIPGGINSKYFIENSRPFFIIFPFNLGAFGERLDNAFGGNPNPSFGQIYGGAPGVGGFGGFGSGYGYSYAGW